MNVRVGVSGGWGKSNTLVECGKVNRLGTSCSCGPGLLSLSELISGSGHGLYATE